MFFSFFLVTKQQFLKSQYPSIFTLYNSLNKFLFFFENRDRWYRRHETRPCTGPHSETEKTPFQTFYPWPIRRWTPLPTRMCTHRYHERGRPSTNLYFFFNFFCTHRVYNFLYTPVCTKNRAVVLPRTSFSPFPRVRIPFQQKRGRKNTI